MSPWIATTQRRNSRGVGLIEVLLALVVLSIGFLTAANLQIRGLRTNQSAFHESQALLMLSDMMDRMRSNPDGVSDGDYSNKSTGDLTQKSCTNTSCSASDIAAMDLYEWSSNLKDLESDTGFVPLLPIAPDGTVASGSISLPVDGIFTLSMTWKEQDGADLATRTTTVQFRP